MTSLTHLAAAEPDLASRAVAILTSTTNAVLGTIRADGTPRLSGIDPFLADGELWIGSMPGARKADDLKRDPRMSMHGIPWESRKVKEGATDPGGGDVKLTGRAVLATAEAKAAAFAAFAAERGVEPPDPDTSDAFRIELDSLVVISVVEEELQVDTWTASAGRSTIRRR